MCSPEREVRRSLRRQSLPHTRRSTTARAAAQDSGATQGPGDALSLEADHNIAAPRISGTNRESMAFDLDDAALGFPEHSSGLSAVDENAMESDEGEAPVVALDADTSVAFPSEGSGGGDSSPPSAVAQLLADALRFDDSTWSETGAESTPGQSADVADPQDDATGGAVTPVSFVVPPPPAPPAPPTQTSKPALDLSHRATPDGDTLHDGGHGTGDRDGIDGGATFDAHGDALPHEHTDAEHAAAVSDAVADTGNGGTAEYDSEAVHNPSDATEHGDGHEDSVYGDDVTHNPVYGDDSMLQHVHSNKEPIYDGHATGEPVYGDDATDEPVYGDDVTADHDDGDVEPAYTVTLERESLSSSYVRDALCLKGCCAVDSHCTMSHQIIARHPCKRRV